jgi:hypothetical protein
MAIEGRFWINSISLRSTHIRGLGSSYGYYEIRRVGRNRTTICMADEEEFYVICSFYIVFAIFYEIFCTAISMVDEKEIRAICSFSTVFAIFYFTIFFEIFTTDQ